MALLRLNKQFYLFTRIQTYLYYHSIEKKHRCGRRNYQPRQTGCQAASLTIKRKNPPHRLECECGLVPGRLTKWIVGKGSRGNRSQNTRDYLEG